MKKTVQILKALAERNRLRIVAALLQEKELCACQVTELLAVAGATASRHLAQLAAAGILQSRKDGRWMYFKIADDVRETGPILIWLDEMLADSPDLAEDRRKLAGIMTWEPEAICRRQRCGETNNAVKEPKGSCG